MSNSSTHKSLVSLNLQWQPRFRAQPGSVVIATRLMPCEDRAIYIRSNPCKSKLCEDNPLSTMICSHVAPCLVKHWDLLQDNLASVTLARRRPPIIQEYHLEGHPTPYLYLKNPPAMERKCLSIVTKALFMPKMDWISVSPRN